MYLFFEKEPHNKGFGADMSEYKYTDKCDEISGFGGSYEDGCRKMVIAGMEWFDKHPQSDPKFTEYKNIYGFINDENEDATQLTDHMNKSIDNEATGAMMQACVNHVKYAYKHGWDNYIKKMEERDK